MVLSENVNAKLKALAKQHGVTIPSLVDGLLTHVLASDDSENVVSDVASSLPRAKPKGRSVDVAKAQEKIAMLEAKIRLACGAPR